MKATQPYKKHNGENSVMSQGELKD